MDSISLPTHSRSPAELRDMPHVFATQPLAEMLPMTRWSPRSAARWMTLENLTWSRSTRELSSLGSISISLAASTSLTADLSLSRTMRGVYEHTFQMSSINFVNLYPAGLLSPSRAPSPKPFSPSFFHHPLPRPLPCGE